MARNRKFEVSALNIVTHPHSTAKYIELFRTLARMRTPVPVRGEYHGMIGSAHSLEGDAWEKGLYGEIWKFFNLDTRATWYNVVKHRRADPAEEREIKIPGELKPHFSLFYYAFFPKEHVLFYESHSRGKGLSAGSVEKMLERLCERQAVATEFGKVNITVEPSTESLERILRMPDLRKLRIEVTTPNADDLRSATREIMERLQKMNAGSQIVELRAERHESLNPDEEVKTLAAIAQSNGTVEGEGYVDDRRVYESTEEHPLKETATYHPNKQSNLDAFVSKARQMLSVILRRRR